VGWEQTIRTVIDMAPDRLAIYSYAHLPERFKHQAKMDATTLPNPQTKNALITVARSLLGDAGYRAIGMDHFARPGDELFNASENGRLHRNFMGYTTIADTQVIGIGPSAISFFGDAYAQNEKRLAKYYLLIESAELATSGGIALTQDDIIRRWTIEQLMCNFRLSFQEFADRFGVDFTAYFAQEVPSLEALKCDGFLNQYEDGILVQSIGKAFVRNLAMVFDAYLKNPNHNVQYSQTV